ncbi:hypothetical protein DB35_03250 [Streptomyces abyssalis]|uniref:Low molecular weight antigen MTB12-like C-terminal domain-containing protein n=1 Tax=Streptomyces abyssalis TaxID=933944 RepID=A0A1E7JPU6_9ACTN|nr:hypothetical protein [Streptomyces abyssalis]OEU90302.1 hypothetical protein AN215_12365 [Streptomyces abyssalis]OEU95039.1 hypothetical protein DB35_03250 [Streptomyces abyssalis]
MASPARCQLARHLPAAVAALVLVGGCSDGEDKGRPDDSTSPKPASSSSRPSPDASTSPPQSKSPTPTGSAPEHPLRAESEVRNAWQKFFDPGTSVDEKVDLVEDGEQNELMIRPLFTDQRSKELRAATTSVTFRSSQDAEVAYRLTLDGQALEDGDPGGAVLQDKKWKITLQTVCALTKHGRDVPQAPACDEPQ